MTTQKRISPNAYQALREALPVVFHYKRPFESFLRSALRDHPELLAGINFGDLKRYVADEVVRRLVRDEARYQDYLEGHLGGARCGPAAKCPRAFLRVWISVVRAQGSRWERCDEIADYEGRRGSR